MNFNVGNCVVITASFYQNRNLKNYMLVVNELKKCMSACFEINLTLDDKIFIQRVS